MRLLLLILLFSGGMTASADETVYRLPPLPFIGDASFETLDQDTLAPKQTIRLDQNRSGTLESLGKNAVFPVTTTGYPSGTTTISSGGRSGEDTQVSTLGVPLNLPQGGGADLSIFPAFLWSEAEFSSTVSSSGYSPQASSGSLQLKLWTREKIRSRKKDEFQSRVTGSYDRLLQNFSLATATENFAMVAGLNAGFMSGPAGSLSYSLLQQPGHHLLFHLLGSAQDGQTFGSVKNPTPTDHKKLWRVIPVLESHQELTSDFIVESTLYADLQEMQIVDPVAPSDTRTQQFGLENAVLFGPYTYALSVRSVLYTGAMPQRLTEWPVYSTLARDFFPGSWTARFSGGGAYSRDSGINPLGKASAKIEISPDQDFFGELGSTPKMPTLVARYFEYKSPFYNYSGNPSLAPERVNSLLMGFQKHQKGFEATTTLKGEYRTDVQLNTNTPAPAINTTINAGSARLLYARQDLKWKPSESWELATSTLTSYSRLQSGLTYPDLPAVSQQGSVTYFFRDNLGMTANGKYTGPSTASDGRFHSNYALFDSWISYVPSPGYGIVMGIDNIFDQRAQVVLDYPLPGRVVYLSGQAKF